MFVVLHVQKLPNIIHTFDVYYAYVDFSRK
jgi:hypothetical protein